MDVYLLMAAQLVKRQWESHDDRRSVIAPREERAGEPLLRLAVAIAVIGIAVTAMTWVCYASPMLQFAPAMLAT